MKGMRLLLLLTFIAITFTGCFRGRWLYDELPENPIRFEMGGFVDPDDPDEMAYGTIEYNGRTYASYGCYRGIMRPKDVGKCLGYIVQDGREEDDDMRVLLLADDPDANYLVCCFLSDTDTLMRTGPMFFRAVDTKGCEIFTPRFIKSLDYELFWNNANE